MKKSNKKRVVTAFDNITSFICVIAFAYIIWSILTIVNGSKGILDGIISIVLGLIIIIGFSSLSNLYDKNEDLANQLNELKKRVDNKQE